MMPLALGPVDVVVAVLDGDHPSPGFLDALLRPVDARTVRLLDFAVIRRTGGERIEILEVDPREFELAGLTLHAPGLAAEDDIRRLCLWLPEGTCAAVFLIELAWAHRLADELDRSGAHVVVTARIPAGVASAVFDLASEDATVD